MIAIPAITSAGAASRRPNQFTVESFDAAYTWLGKATVVRS